MDEIKKQVNSFDDSGVFDESLTELDPKVEDKNETVQPYNEVDDSVRQDDLPEQITTNAQDHQNGNFDNKENEANGQQLPIAVNSTTSTEAHVVIQRPDPPVEGLSNRDREAVIEWLLKKLLTLLEGHCFLQEGIRFLSVGGWEIAEDYLNKNRDKLSWLNVVNLEEKNNPEKELLAFLAKKVYGPREIWRNNLTRVLQSTVKFPLGPPTQSFNENRSFRFAYWNCEHIGANTENGAWKRQVLYSQTKMLKLDMILLLETKGCDWTAEMFQIILQDYQRLELPSYDKNRGVALLFRSGSKETPAWLGNPTGFDGGCRHQGTTFKSGDQEFLSIDIKVDDQVYRIVTFYHAGPKGNKDNCVFNLFELLHKEIQDPSVHSLVVLGDNNINFDESPSARKKLDEHLLKHGLTKAIPGPTTWPSFYRINMTGDQEQTQTQPDIFLSRLGKGSQLFHKPIDAYSWVKSILSSETSPMKNIRGTYYKGHCEKMRKMFPKKGKQTTHPGPGDGHLITIVELGTNLEEPFSDIFERAAPTSAKAKPTPSTPSLFCSTEGLSPDEVAQMKDKGLTFPCGEKCVFHEVFPYIPYENRTHKSLV